SSRFGSSGIAKVPFIIIDRDLKGKLKYPFSHAQAGALLEYLNLEKAEYFDFNYLPDFENDVNTKGKAMFYQTHSPADRVIIVDGLNEDGSLREYVMTLMGDNTSISGEGLSDIRKKEIFQDTYWIRK
ncbi:MAG: hypothetical protein ACI4M9_04060, partial [Succinivibrio sp.]